MNERKYYIIDKLSVLATEACSSYDDVGFKVLDGFGACYVIVKFYLIHDRTVSESVDYNIDYLERGFRTSYLTHDVLMKFSNMVELVHSTMHTSKSKKEDYSHMYKPFTFLWIPGIKKVIFNDPATIVLWSDGSKTVVKNSDAKFDPEKGLAMAISKKALGNKGNYYNTFREWLPEEK